MFYSPRGHHDSCMPQDTLTHSLTHSLKVIRMVVPYLCIGFDMLLPRKKKTGEKKGMDLVQLKNRGCDMTLGVLGKHQNLTLFTPLRCRNQEEEIREKRKTKKKKEMASISDLIHRVTSTCLTHPIARAHGYRDELEEEEIIEVEEEEEEEEEKDGDEEEEEEEREERILAKPGRMREMETLMAEVFDAVAGMKRAYISLQEAHCPWDPEKMRLADGAVVSELRRLARLKDRFRRGGIGVAVVAAAPIREMVAPYEAALEEMRRELKVKEAEVENLKEKLKSPTPRKKGRFHGSKRVSCSTALTSPPPTPELFETIMEQVKEASKSFSAHLLSLMRSARWDIAAAVRSIIDGDGEAGHAIGNQMGIPAVEPHHAKHALESYVSRRIFHGFENETFYIEGTLASLLNPAEFRRDCYAQFKDMRGMDPAELLGILPTCHFGRFAAKKYLAIVHARMEESLFGGVEQRRAVLEGAHPRTGFYGEFLRLAKAVWLLHLLAFALEPAPAHFEASKGAEFHPEYMESVVRFASGRVPAGFAVGFSVGPGFKLGNGSLVRARVYLVPKSQA
ncbi:hypothetical protein J5N97_002424 [Dioscorea zingiberensis]|uniref:DUF641 domain-containing protein n=1 Tax=Dioscorea zingiberensis TaxID=325984 RepID=A0A9D5D4R1_9LILI|nr:hypothetical protein J5N97_002424 [Dioscorea zingiberensis]